MRLCRVYVPRRLLFIHPFRCVMLFLLVWSVSSSLFFVLVSVVVIVVFAGVVVVIVVVVGV